MFGLFVLCVLYVCCMIVFCVLYVCCMFVVCFWYAFGYDFGMFFWYFSGVLLGILSVCFLLCPYVMCVFMFLGILAMFW